MDFSLWAPGDPAGIAAAITVVLAIAWKVYLRTRFDHRSDQTGVIDRNAHRQLAESYDLLVTQLHDEIARLREELGTMSARMTELGLALEAERLTRQQSDKRADTLQLRVGELEHQLKALGDMT